MRTDGLAKASSTGRKTERQTKEEVGGQHSGVDKDSLHQITKGST